MTRQILLSLVALALLNGQVIADNKKADAVKKVTYDDDVLPIFRSKCGSCHNASDRKGGLVLDNFAAMMQGGSSGSVIEPGDSENSYLWGLVSHESEPSMPPNSDKLPAEQLAVIKKWIDLGALENAGSKVVMKKKPALEKIEISTTRPKNVAHPQRYFGDPSYVPSHANAVTALAVSPWAPLAAVSGYKQVGIYNSQTLEPLGVLPFPEGQAQIAKFSRNGSLLLVGGGRGGESGRVVVYDVRTGERKVELGDEYDEVLAADISSDQTMIALGGPKKVLRVYSVATGELIHENRKHTDWITSIEFSPDGVLLASGDRSNGLIVWEAFSGQLFYDLKGHKGAISDISWRPDSNAMVSASEDGTIKLWEMQNGKNIKSWTAHRGGATAVEYTREGNLVSTGRDRITRYWKGDGSKIRDLPAMKDVGMEVAYDAESKRILAGDWTGQVTIWNAEDGAQVGQIDTNPPTVKDRLARTTSTLSKFQGHVDAQKKKLASLQKVIADRAQAATNSAATAAKAKLAAQEAASQKVKAEAAVKKQMAVVESAKKTLKQSQATVVLLNTQLQQQAENVKKTQAAMKASADGLIAATKAQQASVAALDDLVAKAEAAKKAAEPTQDEKSKLESDEKVKAAIAQWKKAAQSAQAAVEAAKTAVTKAKAQVTQSQKQVTDAKSNLDAATKQLEASKAQMAKANAAVESSQKGVEAAQKELNEAQSLLTTALQNEQATAKAATAAQAAAQKAAEAAKPKAEEKKAIDAVQAALAAAQKEVAAAQSRLARLKKIEAEISKKTVAQP